MPSLRTLAGRVTLDTCSTDDLGVQMLRWVDDYLELHDTLVQEARADETKAEAYRHAAEALAAAAREVGTAARFVTFTATAEDQTATALFERAFGDGAPRRPRGAISATLVETERLLRSRSTRDPQVIRLLALAQSLSELLRETLFQAHLQAYVDKLENMRGYLRAAYRMEAITPHLAAAARVLSQLW